MHIPHESAPLVTVIVPVFRTERYLKRCTACIIGQTYANLEIILVDDGSPDRSPAICDELAQDDHRVTALHQPNAGQGAARNAALDICAGEWVMFVDSDDAIQPRMIEDLLAAALAETADIALCGHRVVSVARIIDRSCGPDRVVDNSTLMREYLSTDFILSGPVAKLFRASLFADVRFPAIRAREDVYILHEILGKATRAVFIDHPYYIRFLRHDSTEGRGFHPAQLASIEVGQRLLEYVTERYSDLVPLAQHRKAQMLARLMAEIRSSFSYRQNRATYDLLRAKLVADLNLMDHSAQQPSVAYLSQAARDTPVFRLRCMYAGFKRVVSRSVQRVAAHTIPSVHREHRALARSPL